MTTKKPILLIGLRPELIDFEAVGMPDLSAPQVRAGIAAQQAALAQAGYEYHSALLDLGETAEAQVREALTEREYACVVIGAGLRVPPPHLTLFEKVLNLVHEHAPRSKICFNTSPTDSLDAVRRWALQPADRAASSEQAAALEPRLDSVGEARGGRVEPLMTNEATIRMNAERGGASKRPLFFATLGPCSPSTCPRPRRAQACGRWPPLPAPTGGPTRPNSR